MNKIKILIADDHKIFTNSLRLLIESNPSLEVIDEVFDGSILVQKIQDKEPEIVLLDINMPVLNGIEVLTYFKSNKEKYTPKFIVISMFTDQAVLKKIQHLGAMAFLPKNLGKDELMETIIEVYNSNTPIFKDLKVINSPISSHHLLTKKEKEILLEISNGLSNRAISEKLFCSLFTVQTHRRNIHSKLGIKGHSALLNFIHTNKHLL